jgi:hypothetical protein
MMATARVQPADARSIFTGKHEIVIRLAEFRAGAGVDDDDLQRRERVADPLELLLDVVGGCGTAIK